MEQEARYRQELDELNRQMSDPAVAASPEAAKLGRRHAELTDILRSYDQVADLKHRLEDVRSAMKDPELAELAAEELPELQQQLTAAEDKLQEVLIPRDPRDAGNAIVEIRAGAGGDEASLFAGELLRMYLRFAERRGWKTELMSQSESEVGGYKEVILEIEGAGAYGDLRLESGVHRVQRVPVTESGGRIHTSTVTVAVLPEAEESDIEIDPKDLRIDVYRSSGHGGQSVNTTDSAVRITHLPTGMVVTCQDEKSQLKNKLKAMSVLRSRLLAAKMEEERKQLETARRSQIGTGDRSEKIRTYNFPQDRVTDHRIGYSRHNLPGFLDGDLGEMIQSLHKAELAAAQSAL